MNVISLVGRVVADPQLKYTTTGKACASFRLAVDRQFKKEGEQAADFIDIVAWGQPAEFAAAYLTKGRLASVVGRLQIRQWEQDGQKRTKAEVVAESLRGLDKPRSAPDDVNEDPFAEE